MRPLHSVLISAVCALALLACSSGTSGSAADDSTETSTTTTTVTASTTTDAPAVDTTVAPEEPTAETTTTTPTPVTTTTEIAADPACGLSVSFVFDEGAPRDRMTIGNDSIGDVSISAVDFDLTNSAGQVIFDTLEGGSGVEVFQDFQVEGGDATLAETPVAEDGASSLRLDFNAFDPGQTLTFSIDVDDQLADSDLGQIQVTGGELAGAEAIVTTTSGASAVAVFGNDDSAELVSTC